MRVSVSGPCCSGSGQADSLCCAYRDMQGTKRRGGAGEQTYQGIGRRRVFWIPINVARMPMMVLAETSMISIHTLSWIAGQWYLWTRSVTRRSYTREPEPVVTVEAIAMVGWTTVAVCGYFEGATGARLWEQWADVEMEACVSRCLVSDESSGFLSRQSSCARFCDLVVLCASRATIVVCMRSSTRVSPSAEPLLFQFPVAARVLSFRSSRASPFV